MKIFRKNDFIIRKCKNKDVLDLGCIEHDHFRDRIDDGSWVHMNIKKIARSIIGIDLLKEYIPELNSQGYKIYYGDVEKLSDVSELKGKKFDVIVAGDLIEHLFNQGLFLDSIKPFCTAETELIITTPNCFSTHFFIPHLWKGVEPNRDDHTLWHSARTLRQLLLMKGYKITELHFRNDQIINGIRPFFRVMFKRIFPHTSHGLIVVARIDK